MGMTHLEYMTIISSKAVNEMLTSLAAGALAGTPDLAAGSAAKIAIDTAEILLKVTQVHVMERR